LIYTAHPCAGIQNPAAPAKQAQGTAVFLLLRVEFTLLNGLFDRVPHQRIVPFIVKRHFCPDNRLNLELHLVMAGFTNIPVGQMKVTAPGNGRMENTLANITSNGLHIQTPEIMV